MAEAEAKLASKVELVTQGIRGQFAELSNNFNRKLSEREARYARDIEKFREDLDVERKRWTELLKIVESRATDINKVRDELAIREKELEAAKAALQESQNRLRESKAKAQMSELKFRAAIAERDKKLKRFQGPDKKITSRDREAAIRGAATLSRKRPIELLKYLQQNRMEYQDNRPKGALWVLGPRSLKPFFSKLEKDHGILFTYFSAPKATRGEPAWWTKDPSK